MAKIGFCAISGSGMSALAQISKYQGNDVYGSDRSFDQGKDQQNKHALEELGIKISAYYMPPQLLKTQFRILNAPMN